MSDRTEELIRLQGHPDGVGAGIRSTLQRGRYEQVTAGPTPEMMLIGGDPYNTNAYTGLVVPPVPSASIGNARYLFLLDRASFGNGEQNQQWEGVRLTGIRQYAEIVSRVARGTVPLAGDADTGTITFRREIESPLWHPPDGNISWHVMVVPPGFRDTRNPANTDGLIYQDAKSAALLYQTLGPYTPPNGGRPWGTPLIASLGNIHELRYKWRGENAEYALDIPIPTPCDVLLFASVRQNDPALNPVFQDDIDPNYFSALSNEDKFLVAFNNVQYGSIAGALSFDQSIGKNVP